MNSIINLAASAKRVAVVVTRLGLIYLKLQAAKTQGSTNMTKSVGAGFVPISSQK
jgi:hypothetical protein